MKNIKSFEIVTLLEWSDYARQTYQEQLLESWEEKDGFALPSPAHLTDDKVSIITEERQGEITFNSILFKIKKIELDGLEKN